MASRFALLMKNFRIFTTLLAYALAFSFVLFLTNLTKSHPTGQTNLRIDLNDGESASVTGLTVTETLTYHFLMFDTDVLETDLAFIAFWLIPRSIVTDNCV